MLDLSTTSYVIFYIMGELIDLNVGVGEVPCQNTSPGSLVTPVTFSHSQTVIKLLNDNKMFMTCHRKVMIQN